MKEKKSKKKNTTKKEHQHLVSTQRLQFNTSLEVWWLYYFSALLRVSVFFRYRDTGDNSKIFFEKIKKGTTPPGWSHPGDTRSQFCILLEDIEEFLCKLLHYKIKQKVVIFKVHLRNTTIIEEKTVIKSSKCDLTEMMKVACKDACTTGSLGEFSWMWFNRSWRWNRWKRGKHHRQRSGQWSATARRNRRGSGRGTEIQLIINRTSPKLVQM